MRHWIREERLTDIRKDVDGQTVEEIRREKQTQKETTESSCKYIRES